MDKGKLILKQDHTNCDIVATDQEAYLLRDPYWGNSKGNVTKRGNWHQWYNVICNDPRCSFSAIVEWFKLSEFIKSELKVTK